MDTGPVFKGCPYVIGGNFAVSSFVRAAIMEFTVLYTYTLFKNSFVKVHELCCSIVTSN